MHPTGVDELNPDEHKVLLQQFFEDSGTQTSPGEVTIPVNAGTQTIERNAKTNECPNGNTVDEVATLAVGNLQHHARETDTPINRCGRTDTTQKLQEPTSDRKLLHVKDSKMEVRIVRGTGQAAAPSSRKKIVSETAPEDRERQQPENKMNERQGQHAVFLKDMHAIEMEEINNQVARGGLLNEPGRKSSKETNEEDTPLVNNRVNKTGFGERNERRCR